MDTDHLNTAEAAILDHSRALIEASRALGATHSAALARVWCIPYLVNGMEQVFASDKEPIGEIYRLFDKLAAFLKSTVSSGLNQLGGYPTKTMSETATGSAVIENITGEHYGRLFRSFSDTSFWKEPVELLRTRLERNCIDLSPLPKQVVLDAGCGGGRYTVAWRLLGARHAIGIDISSSGILSAQQRVQEAGLDEVSFCQANVLDLPWSDNSFEIVFSNGVLHHTVDWKRGVGELVRIIKPGGLGWLYLIENPGGLFWAVIEVLRELMRDVSREFARASLQMLGIPDNRIFYLLDHVMVPINLRLTPIEIERCLALAGAIEIRRLTRGADFDRVERIYQNEPFADVKYGIGENRYVFSKG